MIVFDRLCIGTANWGQAYGHRGVTCPREEQEKILAYAMSCGINTLHTKTEYGSDLSWITTYFEILDPNKGETWSPYDKSDMVIRTDGQPWDWVNLPYSPFNRTWEDWMEMAKNKQKTKEIHVRSIYVQGKVFTSNEPVFVRFRKYAREMGLPAGTLCILFCLLNPYVDKVIIGVDSERQLRDNLRFFHRIDGFGVDDPKVIDPRIFAKGAQWTGNADVN